MGSETYLSQPESSCESRSLRGDTVIVVHGFAANRLVMSKLAKQIEVLGCEVINWGYSSLRHPIERHVTEFEKLVALHGPRSKSIHFVGHSMGSIIIHACLSMSCPANLGRAVMICPPLRGSPIARLFESTVGRLFPPIVDMSTRQDSYVNQLPDEFPTELGVIATPYDHMVPVSRTRRFGNCEHLSVVGSHSSVLWSSRVARSTRKFLVEGSFRGSDI